MSYRIERDALGSMELPVEALYGIQTERARRNFPISGLRPLEPLVVAQVWIKKAAALTHGDTGRLDSRRVQAIVAAADEVLAGAHRDQVPAVPTALEAHERVGGPAATRQSVLVQAVIASYTRPTPIETPILEALMGWRRSGVFSPWWRQRGGPAAGLQSINDHSHSALCAQCGGPACPSRPC